MASGASNTPGPGPFVPGILVSEFIGRCVVQRRHHLEDSVQLITYLAKANISNSRSRDRENQTRGWSALWDAAQNNLWDRGKPSPALMDLIESGTGLIPRPKTSPGRKPRVLVPVLPLAPEATF